MKGAKMSRNEWPPRILTPLAIIAVGILVGLAIFGTGCMTREIRAIYYNENQSESKSANSQGNNAAQTPMMYGSMPGANDFQADGAAVAANDGVPTKANGFCVQNGSFSREADISTTAELLKDVEGSQATQTPTTAQRQSQGTGGTSTATLTSTPTVKTLTDNAVQTPVAPQGSAQTGDLQQQSPSSTGGGAGTQTTTTDKSKTITCPTCGATGVTATTADVAADGTQTWTCEECGTINPWSAETCTKEGCDNCRDCQANP